MRGDKKKMRQLLIEKDSTVNTRKELLQLSIEKQRIELNTAKIIKEKEEELARPFKIIDFKSKIHLLHSKHKQNSLIEGKNIN